MKRDEEDKTTQPPEETTTPAPVQSAEGILHKMCMGVAKQLRGGHQWVNALVAFIFGIVMVFDGEYVFRWLIIGAVFLLCCVVAMSDVSAAWGLDSHSYVRSFVGLEVGALGAYLALLGMEGMQAAVGALLGGVVAYQAQQHLIAWGAVYFDTHKSLVLLLYTVIVLLSVFLFKRKMHLRALAIVSAAAGGVLVASAMAWALTDMALRGWLDPVLDADPSAVPKDGPWLDFFLLLVSPSSPDVGVFSGQSWGVFGQVWRIDRALGLCFAFVLFLAGAATQLRMLRRRQATSEGAAPAGAVKAREICGGADLRCALLPAEA
uniref:DUF4203 domain-containing protein n=1 Tax=Zooxanthella nutricula TaxID=1333877 RepID=A0A7S2IVY1_9DINO